MGSLTPGFNLPIGSSIGQIPEAQPASSNIVLDSSSPTVGQAWSLNGTATMADSAADQWNAGFIPQLITSNNGNADSAQGACYALGAIPATIYSVSFEVTVDGNSGCLTPTGAASVEVDWTGGVARQDKITFNPATGQILTASPGLSKLNSIAFVGIKPNGKNLVCYRMTFTVAATPAATTTAVFKISPKINAGVGDIVAGAFQIEAYPVATAYIPTDNVFASRRGLGLQPRQVTDRSQPMLQWGLTTNTYQYGIDCGYAFTGQIAGGQNVFTFPNPPAATNALEFDGDFVTLNTWDFGLANPAGTFLVQGGTNIKFFGPGFATAGVNSFVIPPSATFQDISITLLYDGANGWHILSSNVGAFTAAGVLTGGGINPVVGGAGVILRSNGAAYVASQDTWPDLVAADQILFATAANTVGSVAGLKYNDTSGTLTVKGSTHVCTAAGSQTMPLQPAFLAARSADLVNATGDGTNVSFICDTEILDQQANYNSATGVFTAPVTGVYSLQTLSFLISLGAAHTTQDLRIVTSNRSYRAFIDNITANPFTQRSLFFSVPAADLDAGDTAFPQTLVGGGGKTVGISGLIGGNFATMFSGALIC